MGKLEELLKRDGREAGGEEGARGGSGYEVGLGGEEVEDRIEGKRDKCNEAVDSEREEVRM